VNLNFIKLRGVRLSVRKRRSGKNFSVCSNKKFYFRLLSLNDDDDK
jgi:hypothetical protein